MCSACAERLSEVLDDFVMTPKATGGTVDDPHDSSQHARDRRSPYEDDEAEANVAGLTKMFGDEDEEDEDEEVTRLGEAARRISPGVPHAGVDVVTGRVGGRRR
jgi:hypothetical protein